jgi:hypothetical protein
MESPSVALRTGKRLARLLFGYAPLMLARKKNTLVSVTASMASIQLWSANVGQKSNCLQMAKVSVMAIHGLQGFYSAMVR